MRSPNQAILLTPPGTAAIAVVRVSGPGVAALLEKHFTRKPIIGRPVHGEWHDGKRVIDDPVVVQIDEQSADVSLHGGVWVIHTFFELARSNGFAVVDSPGVPLPEVAVDGETIIDREVAAYLPAARTELALSVLLAQPAAWKNSGTPRASDQSLHWLLHPPQVAIVGTANVGKSTLANQLFARQRVITADLPGTTRDWVGEIANINGLAVMLVDTPGVRDTTDPLEQQAIALSTPVIHQADLLVLVIDPTQPMGPNQSALLRRFPQAIRVINKSDQQHVAMSGAIYTVATTGQGIDQLRDRIIEHFGCANLDLAQPRIWTQRQRQMLQS